jgi:DNA-binding CsgD family transcriptional regulator
MKGIINLENHISWQFTEKLQEICAPFFEKLNLNYADYARYYKNGKIVLLYTDSNYANYFLRDTCYTSNPPSTLINQGFHLWQEYIDNDFLSIVANQFKHFHGITVVNEEVDYTEIINFAATPENYSILGFYLNQQSVLQQLADYLKNKIKVFLNKLEENPLAIIQPDSNKNQPNLSHNYNKITEMLIADSPHTIRINNENIVLSDREAQCLYFLYKGNTSKEIARKLDISPRTIEMYLDKVRSKTKSKNRIDLLAKLNSQSIDRLEVVSMRRANVW